MPIRTVPLSTWRSHQANQFREEQSGLLGALQDSLAQIQAPLELPQLPDLPSLPSLDSLTAGWGGPAQETATKNRDTQPAAGFSLPSLADLTRGWQQPERPAARAAR